MKVIEAPKIKLDPDVKARWLDALRSGRYQQSRGALCQDEDGALCHIGLASSFCCIGVLGHLEKLHQYERTSDIVDKFSDVFSDSLTVQGNVATEPRTMSVAMTLVEMNDGERLNFNQIADWIEEYL
jgi:hypothetical protein